MLYTDQTVVPYAVMPGLNPRSMDNNTIAKL